LTGHAITNAPRIELPAQRVVIVKDMSEWTGLDRKGVLEEAAGRRDWAYLIVTNTGTLLASARQVRIEGVDPAGLKASSSVRLRRMLRYLSWPSVFLLLNVGRIDSIDTACAVLARCWRLKTGLRAGIVF